MRLVVGMLLLWASAACAQAPVAAATPPTELRLQSTVVLVPALVLAKLAAIRAADSLQRNVPETVAQLTGVEYFKFENGKSLERDLFTISNHVPNRYVLSFHPVAPHAGFHAIELKLKDYPGLRVEARSGYWVDGVATP